MRKLLFLLCIGLNLSFSAKAQTGITIHSESVDSLLRWFNNGCSTEEIPSLLRIPANQIMEQLLHSNEKDAITFSEALHRFSAEHSLPNNDYLLNDAYTKREQISALMKAFTDSVIKKQPLDDVKTYFPTDFALSSCHKVYYTATGWQWGDAMTFNYIQKENDFMLSQEGESAIIFNLSIIVATYGKTVDEQVAAYKKVLAHELFHALLSEYIADKNYYRSDELESTALFLLMNEGIAHFIADGYYIKANYDSLKKEEQSCLALFNEKSKIIFDINEDMELRKDALEKGLYGSYWNKYVAVTGLFMAYHIHQFGGMELLRECIEKGPIFFFETYGEISKANPNLPIVCKKIIND
ncbi:MAG: hypothetical protein LBU91_07695 [Bacteroidales bacterium]|jgi:hypothetical protein|nr:hypothetical protein [Bacteroidales bacterium]